MRGVLGESAEIVEREGAVLLFEPEHACALVQGLVKLADESVWYQHVKSIGPVAAKKYDRKALALKMLSSIERVER